MHRLRSLLVCVALILSLGFGALAHASEGPGCIEAPISSLSGHADGDTDEGPADSGNPYPHHHGGCHNHQIGIAIADEQPRSPADSGLAFRIAHDERLTRAISDPAIRPPRT